MPDSSRPEDPRLFTVARLPIRTTGISSGKIECHEGLTISSPSSHRQPATYPLQQLDSKRLENGYEAQEEDGRQNAVNPQGRPETPTIAEHPGEDQKHGKGRQDEPERTLGMVGNTPGVLSLHTHPDHGQQGDQGQRNEKGGEAIVEELDLGDKEYHEGRKDELRDIQPGKAYYLIPGNLTHERLAVAETLACTL